MNEPTFSFQNNDSIKIRLSENQFEKRRIDDEELKKIDTMNP